MNQMKHCAVSRWSAVRFCNQGTSLFIGQNGCDFPIKIFSPFGSMLITCISVFCFNEDPTFDGAWSMKALPRLTSRERRTSWQKLFGGHLVISGLERPVHQKSHRKKNDIDRFAQKQQKREVINGFWFSQSPKQKQEQRNQSIMTSIHFISKSNNRHCQTNKCIGSIKITQISTRQTDQPQKQETNQAQQTRHWCNQLSISKNT